MKLLIKKNLYSESLFNTLYIDIKKNNKKRDLKKFPSDKIIGTKKALFSFVSTNSSQFYF